MRTLLESIYHGNYERPLVRTPAYEAASRAVEQAWGAAEAKLSREELDELWTTATGLSLLEGYGDFRDGFCLGVSLMLEYFSRPTEK